MGAHRIAVGTRSSRLVMLALGGLLVAAVFLPFFAGRSALHDLFFILTMLTLVLCWNLLAGYVGLVSIGQQAFVGIGAYAMFAFVILLDVDPLLSIPLAGLVGLAAAVPMGFVAFRLHGAYFAIGTWVLAEVIRLLVSQWKQLGGGTGTSLPKDAVNNMLLVDFAKEVFDVKTSFARDIVAFWVALLVAAVAFGAIYALLRSRHGLALAAVRDNRAAASSVGIDAGRSSWLVYLATAALTSMTGALIYVQLARISPDAAFSVLDWTAYVIFIAVIGGIGTLEGPIIGVIVFFFLQNTLADHGSWYLLLLGLLGVLVMLFARQGLWGLVARLTGYQLFPVRRRLVAAAAEPD